MTRLALLPLLLLLVPGPSLAQAPQGLPDIEVRSVRYQGDGPQFVDGVAQGATLVTTVFNRGNQPITGYRLHYTHVGAGGSEGPLNVQGTDSTDVQERTLEPGRSFQHTWPWMPQLAQAGPGMVRVRAELGASQAADTNPNNDQARMDVDLPVRNVAARFVGGAQQIHPGETIFQRLRIENGGNVREELTLRAAPPAGPASRLTLALAQQQVSLAPGAWHEADLFVTEAPEPDHPDFATPLTVTVERTKAPPVSASSPSIRTTRLAYDLAEYAADLQGPDVVFAASSPAAVQVFAWNRGQAADVYDLAVEHASGFTLDVAPRRIGLLPGERVPVQLTVAAALGTQTAVPVQLSLRSLHPVPETALPILLRPWGPALSVGLEPLPPLVYQGDGLRVTVLAANEGNEATGPRLLEVVAASSGTGAANPPPVPLALPSLLPGTVHRETVDLGRLVVPGPVAVHLRDGDDGRTLAQGESLVHVPRIHVIAPPPASGIAGEEVRYGVGATAFRVRNVGLQPESLTLHAASPLGAARLLQEPAFTLEPGEVRTVALSHALPEKPGNATQAPLTLVATLAGRPGFSWSNGTRTDIRDSLGPTITVPWKPHAWWHADPLEFPVLLADASNVTEATLFVLDPQGHEQAVPLRRLDGLNWTGAVRFAGEGTHALRLDAVDGRGNRASAPAFQLRVMAHPVPTVVASLPASGTWNLSRPLPLLLGNAANATSVQYSVLRDGQVFLEGALDVAGGTLALDLGELAPGNVTLELAVVAPHATGGTTYRLLLVDDRPSGPSDPGPTAPPQQASGLTLVAAISLLGLALARRRTR